MAGLRGNVHNGLKGQCMQKRRSARYSTYALLLLASTCLGSCAALEGYENKPENKETIEQRRNTYYGSSADDAYYKAAASDRQAIRNDLVYGKMQVLEDDFLDFERSLNSAGNYISVGADLGALVLNGLGATTGTAATKSALSAASAGVIGAQGDVNKDLYYQKTLPALIAQMQANREKARLVIVQNLAQSDTAYPLNSAEIDLKKLEEAGSLVNAVNTISQTSNTQKDSTQAQIQQFQALSYSGTPAAVKLRAWLYPNGKVNQTNFDALQGWLNDQPEAFLKGQNYPPAAFVAGDTTDNSLDPIRQRALADPKLNIP